MTQADLIIVNGAVLTMDQTNLRAEAVALRGSRILAVGRNDQIMELRSPKTRIIDARGGSVLPGFIENHMHLFIGGAELGWVKFAPDATLAQVTPKLRAYAEAHSDLPVVMCQGMGYRLFSHGKPREIMDQILPDRPWAMMSDDHHTVWANTAALDRAGVLHGADLSEGHEVVMGDDGLATGTLLEPEAYAYVLRAAGLGNVFLGIDSGAEPCPAPSNAQRDLDKSYLKRGLDYAVSHGITSIVNMDGNRYTLELLDELRSEDALTARVRVPFHFVPDMDDSALASAAEMHARWNNDWLTSGFVKMFMDGVLESGTAFMKNDYPTRAGWRASGRFSPERFNALATQIDKMGLQIAVHAIGDAAVARVIDGYEAAQIANKTNDMRHRVEHIELIDPTDIPRLAELGLVASMQPLHSPANDADHTDQALRQIPRERWRDAFALRRIGETGVAMALASDWSVASISVLEGIQTALTLKPWNDGDPKRRLSLHHAIAGYTIGGAFAEHTDTIKGSLSPGKLGDVVILDRDIEATAPEDIAAITVRATICGGRITHDALI